MILCTFVFDADQDVLATRWRQDRGDVLSDRLVGDIVFRVAVETEKLNVVGISGVQSRDEALADFSSSWGV
jgi:hypothetical protein